MCIKCDQRRANEQTELRVVVLADLVSGLSNVIRRSGALLDRDVQDLLKEADAALAGEHPTETFNFGGPPPQDISEALAEALQNAFPNVKIIPLR